jgi:hypothetical protein
MARAFDRTWSNYTGHYHQNEPENKAQFESNWDLIFGKKEKPNANQEGIQSQDNQQEHINRNESTSGHETKPSSGDCPKCGTSGCTC